MIWKTYPLLILALASILSACGPSQAELGSTATQMAADAVATQTALAPTDTPTFTPSPTSTSTQTPTASPTITPSPTDKPTITPTATPRLMAAALTLDDLPTGFNSASNEELNDMQADLPRNAVAFGYSDETTTQFIMGILLPLTNRTEQRVFDQAQPQYAELLAQSVGVDALPKPLSGLDDIGETRAGSTFSFDAMGESRRWDIVVFRRGEVGEILFVIYPTEEEPAISISDLARLLDDRLSNLQDAGG